MTKISDVISGIKDRFVSKVDANTKVMIMDDIPAVVDVAGVYIVSPSFEQIIQTPYIGGTRYVEYDVRIYGVTHVVDKDRADNVGDNVVEALKIGEQIMEECFPVNERYIGTSQIASYSVGSETWIPDGYLLTAYQITLSFVDFIE
jgi:hypothetical protein